MAGAQVGPSGINVQKGALTGYDLASISRKSPQQMELYNLLFQGSKGGLQGGLGKLSGLARGDEGTFSQLEAPAFRDFDKATGQLASRFSGEGSGARNSSGFQNAATEQAGSLAERLQGQRLGIQQQSLTELLGLGRHLLDEDLFDTYRQEPKKHKWESILGGVLPYAGAGLGAIGGSFFGNPLLGAQLGSGLGSAASKAFF